jgi:hypothetical protein
MRVYGANAAGLGVATQTVRRGASGTFMLPEEASPRAARTGTMQSVGGIDALLALQGIEDPTERRRRAVARGRQVLDVLDEIRLGLLAGSQDGSALGRLKGVVAQLKQETGDPALDQVLAEIELRAEVELAKAGL